MYINIQFFGHFISTITIAGICAFWSLLSHYKCNILFHFIKYQVFHLKRNLNVFIYKRLGYEIKRNSDILKSKEISTRQG